MSSDSIGNILLVFADQLIQHLLSEGAQVVLQHLDNLAVPLLVILSDVFPMAELVRPVGLDPVPVFCEGIRTVYLQFTCRHNFAEQIYPLSVAELFSQSTFLRQIFSTDSPSTMLS